MAKFDLSSAYKAAVLNSTPRNVNKPMSPGYHLTVITQVAEIGQQQYGQNEPKECIGMVFENEAGEEMYSRMTKIVHLQSNLYKVITAVDVSGEVNELKDLLGKELVLEIQNGNNGQPRIIGFHSLDMGLTGTAPFQPTSIGSFYSIDNPDPEVLKKVHPQMRQDISNRVRNKGV